MQAHYARGDEHGRLDNPAGQVEFNRTVEMLGEWLPPAPAVVADIGGGPGRYTLWLAERGYTVHHRDLVPLHVEQLESALGPDYRVESALGDARHVDLAGASVDAVLRVRHCRKPAASSDASAVEVHFVGWLGLLKALAEILASANAHSPDGT
jgi:SAM-dependent methyltransferase